MLEVRHNDRETSPPPWFLALNRIRLNSPPPPAERFSGHERPTSHTDPIIVVPIVSICRSSRSRSISRVLETRSIDFISHPPFISPPSPARRPTILPTRSSVHLPERREEGGKLSKITGHCVASTRPVHVSREARVDVADKRTRSAGESATCAQTWLCKAIYVAASLLRKDQGWRDIGVCRGCEGREGSVVRDGTGAL